LSPPEAKSIAIIMGSQSDWQTMKHAAETLDVLGVAYDTRIISAHRTPERLYAFAKGAKAEGFKVIIAGAGGAAHLPGMTAALTTLPVFGVPVESKFHRADATRHPGGYARDRQRRRHQRGALGRKCSGAERSGAGQPLGGLAAKANRGDCGKAQRSGQES